MGAQRKFPTRWAKPINIDGFKGKYLITKSARILNTHTGHEVKPWRDMSAAVEYSRVTLTREDGTNKKYYLHRLVALIFIKLPKKDAKYQANHKDMNTWNNHVSNINWLTPSQNVRHGIEFKKRRRQKV